MAIPFVVAVFNDYLLTALEMLKADGKVKDVGDPHRLMLGKLRNALAGELDLPGDYEAVMWFAQELRNDIIHTAGRVGTRQREAWDDLGHEQRDIWSAAAKREPHVVVGEPATLGPGEVRATLAVTHRLVRAVNDELAHAVSQDHWARIVVADWRAASPQQWPDGERRLGRVTGYARQYYADVALTADDLAPLVGRSA